MSSWPEATAQVQLGIERVARKRLLGELPQRSVQPLYVDPPEARIPADGYRPAPVG